MDLHTQIIDAYTSQSYIECINLIDTAPSSISTSSHLKTLKASCLINIEGKCSEAFEILNKIINEEPTNGLAYYSKGLAHLKEGKLELSIECFNMAANLDTKGAISKEQVIKLKEDVMKMKIACSEKERKENSTNLNSPKLFTGSSESQQIKNTKVKKSPKNSKSKIGKKKSSDELDDPKTDLQTLTENVSPKAKRSLTCKICQRSFAQSFSLSRHILIHTGERPHRCSICNAGFIQKSDLNRHMSIHTEVTNYKCEECGKRFKTKKNLSCHQLTHSEARPYKCGECDKDFRYKRLLKYHEGMHLMVKPFHCDFCGKEFSAKPNLKSHLKTHMKRIHKKLEIEKKNLKVDESLKVKEILKNQVENLNFDSNENSSNKIQMTSSEFTNSDSPQPKIEPMETLSDFISISASSRDSLSDEICGNSEWNFFFKSLVGDLSKMDDKQKRKFKTKTFALIDEILE